jgi:hypothetical protein
MQNRGVVFPPHRIGDGLQGKAKLPVRNPHGDVPSMDEFPLPSFGEHFGDGEAIGGGHVADDGSENRGHREHLGTGWNP